MKRLRKLTSQSLCFSAEVGSRVELSARVRNNVSKAETGRLRLSKLSDAMIGVESDGFHSTFMARVAEIEPWPSVQ